MRRRRYRWDTGLRVRVLGLVGFLLVLLIGLGTVLSYTFTHLKEQNRRAEQTRQNVLLMEQAAGTFAEMTSALRGYLLTGQEPFLQPYWAAGARMDFTLAELQQSAANSTAQTTRVHLVGELVHSWQRNVAEPEIAARRRADPGAGSIVAGGSGLNYIDEIRKAAKAYIDYESERLQEEIQRSDRAAANMQWTTWIAVLVASALALTGTAIFGRSVTRATGALAAAAESIAAGKRRVLVDATLDGELLEVAEAFTAMSATLADQEETLQAQQEELMAQNEELLAQQEALQERAVTLEQQDKLLSRLNEVGQTLIGTIEIEPLAHQILDEYLDLYGGSAGLLLVSDPHSDKLIVRAERWLSPDWREAQIRPSGPLERCVQRGETVVAFYPETATQVQIWQGELPVSQEVYVPLIHSTRVIGVVVIASTRELTLSEQAGSLSSSIASQASVAILAALNHLEVKRTLRALQEQAAQVEELNTRLEEERDRTSAQLDIYLSIVSTMAAGAWLTDTGGNLLVVNAPFREFFGDLPDNATLDQVLQQMSRQLPAESPFPEAAVDLVQSRDGKGEGRIRLENGYVLQWYSAPVGGAADPIGRLFTFQDVTELAELDRLKSEFVSTVSHELRTPLTSIIGYLNMVLSEQVGRLDPQQKEFLATVSRNTERLANLINDLLDIQRIEAGRTPLQIQPVLLTDLVDHVAQTFRVAAEHKGLTFEVSAAMGPGPTVMGDPDRLTQILSNLVSNAVKYTQEGFVRISAAVYDGEAILTVEDSGVGISAADQKRLFEKFFRGENPYTREAGGTGLGLAIVKILVEEHGGSISVTSQPGKGSCFAVRLPVAG